MLWGNTLALSCRALGRQCCCLRAACGSGSLCVPRENWFSQAAAATGESTSMKVASTLAWLLTTASISGADPVKENQETQLPGSTGRDPRCWPNYLQWITGWPTSSVGCPLYKTHLIHNFKNFHLLKCQPICSSLTVYERFCTEVISDKQ